MEWLKIHTKTFGLTANIIISCCELIHKITCSSIVLKIFSFAQTVLFRKQTFPDLTEEHI